MSLKSICLRVLCVALALLLLLPAGISKGASYDVADPAHCKLHFSVLSDVHIEGNNFPRYKVFTQSLQNLKKNKTKNAAIVFLGDNTMNGQIIENTLFHGAAALYLRGETVLTALGNHDVGNGEGDYETLQNRWYDYTAATFGRNLSHPYYYEVIDGYYFIVLGMESQEVYEMYMSDAQFTWLEGVLAKAAESGKPAFVFSHHPTDYVVDADGNETDRLTNLLADYNQTHDLFCFVGHTHMFLWNYWSFHTSDGFAETYLPRLTELGGANDKEFLDRTGVGVEVELYENEIAIRGRNFFTNAWVVDDEEDGTMCGVTYALKHPITQ